MKEDMINAKEEFIAICSEMQVKCAMLIFGDEFYDNREIVILPINYSNSDYTAFLTHIDIEYDNGYGCQNLFGYIWFVDGTWAERYEYDGLEYWVIKECPVIPKEVLNT